MDQKLSNANVATLLVIALAVIVGVAGEVVTIVNPDSLSFDEYIKTLAGVAGASGLLGIGRGILAGAKQPGGFGAASVDLSSPPTSPAAVSPSLVAPPKDPPEPGGTTLRTP
jgi:hypothetical protein